MQLNIILKVVMLLLLFSTSLCAEDAKHPKVVSTVGMIADLVENIGGDLVDKNSLMGSGVDPHLYKPTRSDIATLLQADIVFYNGLLLEGKMTDALIRVASAGKKVYAVTELLAEEFLLEPKEFLGHFDPHVWMDPQAWRKAGEVVRDKLTDYDPKNSAIYRQNAQNYLAQLDQLDSYAKKTLSAVPEQARILITAHDAFNYFGRRYGFEVIGLQGISTESEAGVQDIERIVKLIVARKIPAIFFETTVSERNMRALVDGCAAKGFQVKIGGSLFSDAMGKPGTYEGTYIGMIDHNVTTISLGLGASAPQGGMLGKLIQAKQPWRN